MLKNMFDAMRLNLNDTQMAQLATYYNLLVSENEKYNLTAITEENDVYLKHFLDSMLIDEFLKSQHFDDQSFSMIDIGTGGGFPSLPVKILYPKMSVTGLDALNKRIHFLELVSEALKFEQAHFIHGRAEDFGQDPKYREQYDIAVSRAVAELRLLLEFVMPFVKVNGYFVAYKSLKSDDELNAAKNALALLKTEYVTTFTFELPNGAGTRDLMIFQKKGNIAKKYPRKPGIPKKSPL